MIFSLIGCYFTLLLPTVLATDSDATFLDHFEGTQINPEKWIVQENTDLSGLPAYGGSVKVVDSHLILSSNGSSYPWIISATNPFPTTGDFAIEFDFTYTCISDWGNGMIIRATTQDSHTDILRIWADNEGSWTKVGIRVDLLGNQVYRLEIPGWEPSGPKLVFRLQYSNERYTLFIDSVEVASVQSQLRPDMIQIGHPPVDYVPWPTETVIDNIGGWNSFKIGYIKMLVPTEISVSTSTSTTLLGFSVDINGTLKTQNEETLANQNVILSYQIPGLPDWHPIASVTTTDNGAFSATWLPTATGLFTIKAEWNGNNNYAGSLDVKNISVLRGTGETLLFVESNSTLSSLSFDSIANKISFTVSGPSGTKGYVRFFVSKTLLPVTDYTKVYIDGKETDYITTPLGEMNLLYFEYSHSTHNVTIMELSETIEPELPSDTLDSDPTTPLTSPKTVVYGEIESTFLTPTTIAIAALVAVAIVQAIIIIYFKKRNR